MIRRLKNTSDYMHNMLYFTFFNKYYEVWTFWTVGKNNQGHYNVSPIANADQWRT